MSVRMHLKAEDSQGNKAEIDVQEFKTLNEAYKAISELKKELEKLTSELKQLKNGNSKRR